MENVRKILTAETKWLILCEDQSGVDLTALIDNLNKEDFSAVSCGINKSVIMCADGWGLLGEMKMGNSIIFFVFMLFYGTYT